MNRWRAAWIVGILSSLVVLLFHSSSSDLFADSDTGVLIRTIRERNAPFSWFLGDWPLFNHFYRPIPTLLFELDNRLYHNNAVGYFWTNAILCACCTLALFWFLREFIDKPVQAVAGAVLFTIWETGAGFGLVSLVPWLALIVLIVAAKRNPRNWKGYIPATLAILFFADLLYPEEFLAGTTLYWLPGRTATSMTLMALLAMACYTRYERLRTPAEAPKAPTPVDLPATRNTRSAKAQPRALWAWAAAALVFTVASFASYEQAVMLPACLFGLMVYFWTTGRRPNWLLQFPIWALLGAYLLLRHQIIPPGKSQYQAQQIRSGFDGVRLSLERLSLPPILTLGTLKDQLLDEGFLVLVLTGFYTAIFSVIVNAVGIYQLKRNWQASLAGWALGILAFLPMAFLKTFGHYYYWPMALRTILTVAAGTVALKLAASAVSPQARQAPPRPDPAPGSLLRP